MDRTKLAGAAPEAPAAEASGVAAPQQPAVDSLPRIHCDDWPGWRGWARNPWRDGALIAASWVVLTVFVFVPTFQILGLVLIPMIATLLVRGDPQA